MYSCCCCVLLFVLISVQIGIITSQNCDNQRRDVVILLDSSSSVKRRNFEKAKRFLSEFINKLDIGSDAVRVGVAQFSSVVDRLLWLKESFNKTEIKNAVKNMRYNQGGTKTAEALRFAYEKMFTVENGDREDVPDLIFVIMDGISKRNDTYIEAKLLHERGIDVVCIGIGDEVDEEELLNIASNKDSAIRVTSFDLLRDRRLNDKILKATCHGLKPKTTTTPTITDQLTTQSVAIEAFRTPPTKESSTGPTIEQFVTLPESSITPAPPSEPSINFKPASTNPPVAPTTPTKLIILIATPTATEIAQPSIDPQTSESSHSPLATRQSSINPQTTESSHSPLATRQSSINTQTTESSHSPLATRQSSIDPQTTSDTPTTHLYVTSVIVSTDEQEPTTILEDFYQTALNKATDVTFDNIRNETNRTSATKFRLKLHDFIQKWGIMTGAIAGSAIVLALAIGGLIWAVTKRRILENTQRQKMVKTITSNKF